MRVPLVFAAVVLLLGSPAAAVDPQLLFEEKCASCHTIGGGDLVGPDLLPSTKFAVPDLQEAVKRMEEHTGALAAAEIDALVGFLAAGGAVDAGAPPPVLRGSANRGRALFFGEARLAAGGSPCFACHAYAGRGGNLAIDLTGVRSRVAEAGLVSMSENPPFPLMRAAYGRHPVTAEEAAHIAAFLAAPPPETPDRGEETVVYRSAFGIAAAALAGVVAVFRRRASGHSRLVRKSGGEA